MRVLRIAGQHLGRVGFDPRSQHIDAADVLRSQQLLSDLQALFADAHELLGEFDIPLGRQ